MSKANRPVDPKTLAVWAAVCHQKSHPTQYALRDRLFIPTEFASYAAHGCVSFVARTVKPLCCSWNQVILKDASEHHCRISSAV